MAEADGRREFGGPSAAQPRRQRRLRDNRLLRGILLLGVPGLIALAGAVAWLASGTTVSTDNAYVKQDVVSVSSEVTGRISSVAVHENQLVKAGDVLFTIDPAPYQLALAKATANVAGAQVRVEQLQTDYATSDVNIQGRQADVRLAAAALARQQELAAQGFTTRASLEAAQNALENARWHVREAEVDARKARAAIENGSAIPAMNPQIALALADRDKAALDLQRTVVRAPFAGRVSQVSRLLVGQYMLAGLPALSIVAQDHSWVEGNFKEDQLEHMKPGQPASVRLDAFPDVELKGHVQSIGAGTGNVFSVLPAQNATGNWVKVTQRVPVRIALDQAPPGPLIAGLSARITVRLQAEQPR